MTVNKNSLLTAILFQRKAEGVYAERKSKKTGDIFYVWPEGKKSRRDT